MHCCQNLINLSPKSFIHIPCHALIYVHRISSFISWRGGQKNPYQSESMKFLHLRQNRPHHHMATASCCQSHPWTEDVGLEDLFTDLSGSNFSPGSERQLQGFLQLFVQVFYGVHLRARHACCMLPYTSAHLQEKDLNYIYKSWISVNGSIASSPKDVLHLPLGCPTSYENAHDRRTRKSILPEKHSSPDDCLSSSENSQGWWLKFSGWWLKVSLWSNGTAEAAVNEEHASHDCGTGWPKRLSAGRRSRLNLQTSVHCPRLKMCSSCQVAPPNHKLYSMTRRAQELCDRWKWQVLPFATLQLSHNPGLLPFLIILQDKEVGHSGCIQKWWSHPHIHIWMKMVKISDFEVLQVYRRFMSTLWDGSNSRANGTKADQKRCVERETIISMILKKIAWHSENFKIMVSNILTAKALQPSEKFKKQLSAEFDSEYWQKPAS